MPAATEFRNVAKVVLSASDLVATRATSPIKMVSRVDTNFNVGTPDYVFVDAVDIWGLGIDWISAVATFATPPVQLSLLLEAVGGPTETLPLSLLPTNAPVRLAFKDPLLIVPNCKVTFQVTGLIAGEDYSIFASVFKYRKTTTRLTPPPGI